MEFLLKVLNIVGLSIIDQEDLKLFIDENTSTSRWDDLVTTIFSQNL